MNLSFENTSVKSCPQIGELITVPYSATDSMQMATMVGIIINCVMWPTGLSANVLVFITVLRKPQLRTVYNTSVLCLMSTDLCVIVVAQTCNVVYLVNKFVTGDYSCSLFFVYNLFTWWCHGLSFVTLLLISIERYFAVFHPFWYEESVTKTRIFCVVLSSWIFWSAVVFILHFIPSISHTSRTIVVTSFFLPSIISTLVIYCKIFKEIQRGNVVQVSPPDTEIQARKSSKTVGLIIGVQVVSFVPSFCLNIVQALSPMRKDLLIHGIFPFAEAAAYMNAVLDPVIYFWRNGEARRSLKELRRNCRRSDSHCVRPSQAKSTSVVRLSSFGEPVCG